MSKAAATGLHISPKGMDVRPGSPHYPDSGQQLMCLYPAVIHVKSKDSLFLAASQRSDLEAFFFYTANTDS